jgi:hypothetical protein
MPSRDLADAHPELADKVRALIERYNAAAAGASSLLITCTYRSPLEQAELYQIGRTLPGVRVTDRDGVMRLSKHNSRPCLAVDLAVTVDPDGPVGPLKPQITWADAAAYKRMGLIAESLGLVWGGRWKLHDCPHVELPEVRR